VNLCDWVGNRMPGRV